VSRSGDEKEVVNDSWTWEEIIHKAVASCSVITVMFNDQPVRCLLDTGSEVSTLTESCYEQVIKDADKDIVDTTSWMTIHAANKLQVPYLGFTEFDLCLGGVMLKDVGFFIAKDSEAEGSTKKDVPGVIGSNVLSTLRSVPHIKDTDLSSVLQAMDLAVKTSVKTSFAKVAGSKIVKIPS
jgi:hypothetical protein